MKLTIEVDDELYRTLTQDFHTPVLRWRRFNTLVSSGEALANMKRRDLDGKLPAHRVLPSRSPTDATDSDAALIGGDDFSSEDRAKIIKVAREHHQQEGVCEIDDSASISDARSEGGDDGVYVQAWVWVRGEDLP